MVRFLKRLLGIEELEARVKVLEESQTTAKSGGSASMSNNVLNEWINGEEDGE